MDIRHRPRRLRRSEPIRTLVRETALHPGELIAPLFIKEGRGLRGPIETLPGQSRLSPDEAVVEAKELWEVGVRAVNLFGYSTAKDEEATEALNPKGIVPRAVRALKDALPELCVQTDVALDPYSIHGHDGLVIDGEVANDETNEVLAKMALVHAEAGCDWVAPPGKMGGRGGRARHRGGRRRRHGEAGSRLPRRHHPGPGGVRRPGRGLQRVGRVRDDRGRVRARVDGPRPRDPRGPDRHQTGGGGHDPHLLRQGGGSAPRQPLKELRLSLSLFRLATMLRSVLLVAMFASSSEASPVTSTRVAAATEAQEPPVIDGVVEEPVWAAGP